MSYVFNIPYRSNVRLKQVMERIKEDKKLQTYWKCSNVMAIERMGYTDHGPTHVKIVSNIALKDAADFGREKTNYPQYSRKLRYEK